MFTNSVFGFLRCYVLLTASAGAGGVAAGYSDERLATYVWVGQGLFGVVQVWAPMELADRIRTGEVVADLLRPVDPVWQYVTADLGRAGFAGVTRFVVPIVDVVSKPASTPPDGSPLLADLGLIRVV